MTSFREEPGEHFESEANVSQPPEKREKRPAPNPITEFMELLKADAKLFEVLKLLDEPATLFECLLLDVVRLSIAKRLEKLQPKAYRAMGECAPLKVLQSPANLKPV